MQVKVEQFCSLATSPSWQTWLYNYNVDLYRSFMMDLRASRGCGQNRDIMIRLLKKIDEVGGGDELSVFLHKYYPHVIDGAQKKNIIASDAVFEYYNPNIMTFPRRIIFSGDMHTLKRTVNGFILDKIKYDSIIIGDKAYVEFLTSDDAVIADKIPSSNWRIAAYRLRNLRK